MQKISPALSFLVAVLIAQSASGQDISWQHTRGPNGSEGRAVEVSPEGMLYVGSFEDGVYRSADQGETWTYFGLEDVHAVYDFAFSSEFVFAATWNGVFRTSRERAEWKLMADGAAFSAARTLEGILFVGFRNGVVSRSEDEGVTWTDVSEGLDGSSVEPDALEIDAEGHLVLGTSAGLFLMEEGPPWTRISADSLHVSSIAIGHGGKILIGTHGQTTRGVLRSEDEGANWIGINGNLEQPLHVSALISYGDDGIIAGTSSGVYSSMDGGSSWTKADNGMHASHVYDVAADSAGVLYAGMIIEAGIYRVSHPTGTWEHVGLPGTEVVSLAFGAQGNVYAAPTNGSVSVLSDATGDWDVLGQYGIGALVVGPNGELLAAEGGWQARHYLLEDDDSTWRTVAAASECSSVRSFHLTSSGGLYAAAIPAYPPVGKRAGIQSDVPCGGVFFSDDFSLSWSHLGFADSFVFDVLETSEQNVLAAAEHGIFFSDDRGETWQKSDGPSHDGQPTSLIEENGGSVFAGTSAGMLRSSDGGESWQSTSLENVSVFDVAVSPAGDVWAASDHGVYWSADNGHTWTLQDLGLAEGAVLELGFNAKNFLFASVQNRGVFRSIEPIPSLIPGQETLPPAFSIGAFPNPSSGNVIFSFSLSKPQSLRIDVFDVVGRKVATLIDSRSVPAGAHEVVWDSGMHASGLYFYRLSGLDVHLAGSLLLTK